MASDLLRRRLLVIAGKGGVGKTTLAAAIGLVAAQAGLRTLLVEVDAKGDLPRAVGLAEAGFAPVAAGERLWVMEMDTQAALEEYLHIWVHLPFLGRLPGLGRIFDFVATAAPGVRELLVVGKICYEIREDHYDLVIVDPPASGHVVSQLGVTSGVGELIGLGLVQGQTSWMLDILSDPATSLAILVATPEETPVEEALELAERIATETPVHLGGALLNRVVPVTLSESELAALAAAATQGPPALGSVVEAAVLAQGIARRHADNKVRLADGLTAALPIVELPELFREHREEGVVAELAEALEVLLW
jgi:anion-transporting  ArsA/GET3 family ATPase